MEAVVMGTGCKRCSQLKQLTEEVLRELGATQVTLKALDSLDAIAQYGPMVMPALVFDGVLLVSGQVPTKTHLTRLICKHLESRQG
jgi:hypothetical protein